ncbi:hypothetical protein [Streptomyces sp. NPDC051016]|uniref:hypothetical protein n=1 Tax=Streptomyces sp. NPDC051016 TaxID=3365638 RepID=UPI0037987324
MTTRKSHTTHTTRATRTARAKRLTGLLLTPVLGACLLAGCDSGSPTDDGPAHSSPAQEQRAHRVADAWRGSAAATAWSRGYHPMADAVRIPESGWHTKADEQAYRSRNFLLRADLPTAAPDQGKVEWATGGTLARPLWGARKAYRSFALNDMEGPRLTVTGAKLGSTTIATSRGPATVPAWLFTLKGYDTPLERVAVAPSPLPRAPVAEAPQGSADGLNTVPGLTAIAKDGRSVTVRATHGACDDGPVVRALETAGSVVLYASVAGARSGSCTADMLAQNVTVKLREPLGRRILLDALTGRPVPYGT